MLLPLPLLALLPLVPLLLVLVPLPLALLLLELLWVLFEEVYRALSGSS